MEIQSPNDICRKILVRNRMSKGKKWLLNNIMRGGKNLECIPYLRICSNILIQPLKYLPKSDKICENWDRKRYFYYDC